MSAAPRRPAILATINTPEGVLSVPGRGILVSDANGYIRQIHPNGTITTLIGNLSLPTALALDGDGDLLFCETNAHVVKRYEWSTSTITIIAGTYLTSGNSGNGGPATDAKINLPRGVGFDPATNRTWISDTQNYCTKVVFPNGE